MIATGPSHVKGIACQETRPILPMMLFGVEVVLHLIDDEQLHHHHDLIFCPDCTSTRAMGNEIGALLGAVAAHAVLLAIDYDLEMWVNEHAEIDVAAVGFFGRTASSSRCDYLRHLHSDVAFQNPLCSPQENVLSSAQTRTETIVDEATPIDDEVMLTDRDPPVDPLCTP